MHSFSGSQRPCFQAGPERFQECTEEFDIILTVEEKVITISEIWSPFIKFRGDFLQVYDQTLEHFSEREAENETPVHVINMNVVDNPEDATIGVM